jgi:arachidonate 15-lipoxygenase
MPPTPDRSTLQDSEQLMLARQQYQYDYTNIPPLALLERLPSTENFSEDWYRLLAKQLRVLLHSIIVTSQSTHSSTTLHDGIIQLILDTLQQQAAVQRDLIVKILEITPQFVIKELAKNADKLDDLLFVLIKTVGLSSFKTLLGQISALLEKTFPTGHVTSLKDYEKLFQAIELPAIASTFQTDESFAYMRVAGFNPFTIERVAELDRRFPVTETQYQSVMGTEDSLTAAGEEGRLYLADYKILEGAVDGTFLQYQKYGYAPLGLFAVPRGAGPNRYLRAVAIQCGQIPSADNPVITPASGHFAWLFAKTIFQISDALVHEPVAHLGRTHLFVGTFVIVTHRQLADNHPLSLLLRPHFEGTLAINDAAQLILIAPEGGVDKLLSFTIDNSRILAVKGIRDYGFNSAMLRNQLKQRGVDDPNLLPIYPYRDDALLIWDAIHAWSSDFLRLYYSTDEDVQNDTALQAWAAEAQAYDGGRVPDFGQENGRIQTLDYLVDAATLIIFTASAQHAAVNFPQKDLMSYAPALSLAGYLPASTLNGDVTEQDYLNLLAPLDQAQRQLNLLYLLGSVYYNRLGEYPPEHFTDPRVSPLLQAFQEKLKQIETTIEHRNLSRPVYPYLLPSRIPQSINI